MVGIRSLHLSGTHQNSIERWRDYPDNIFRGCEKLKYVNLVGALHETIDALLLEERRKTMIE
jgi:hypothetical protein